MSRWRELPASLDQRVRQLVGQLRRLKDHSGLSLASLAAKTTYSRSSWERYLNGKQLPPRDAVEQLARVCGTEPTRLLVLHELAAEAWPDATVENGGADEAVETLEAPEAGRSGGSGESDSSVGPGGSGGSGELCKPDGSGVPDAVGASGEAGEGRAGRRFRRSQVLVAVVAVALAALAAWLLTARPWQDDSRPGGPGVAQGQEQHQGQGQGRGGEQHSLPPFVFVQGRSHPCDVERKGSELRAGYSPTRETLMDLKSSGWEVLEAQCLLRHHGYDPGVTDGSYGPRTKSAAKRFQKARDLVVDGIVGPDTWEELRR
ncbi:helix-turn-helix domain-containing protein [Streptomyces sp. MST-110588]|uniref:helix-turn-helix domain-containing protein n=1 Tax=Streptomyces sp. MST-110588 TaxID=2833628 RepID=UPI001F5C6595|nr:helix-turn-helix domain-containing protein [Streptomyces sp. MST-110588]UNO40316.1 peptidoglycan-binding protein [Streptomyces sp. MST-110588]